MEAAFKPCDASGMCKHLLSRTASSLGETRKGFAAINVYDTKTGNFRFAGVAYKDGIRGHPPIVINVCPFCCKRPGAKFKTKKSEAS